MEILQELYKLQQKRASVIFMWVPAHVGVKGNEAADKLVKQALRATRIEMEISYSRYEIKAIIKKQINQRWQQMWETGNKGRHMYEIQPKVGKSRYSGGYRREENILSRLRIGHTGLNKTMQLMSMHPTVML